LSLPLRWFSNPIPTKWQHLLFWGGLRGGVTLALALSLPSSVPGRETLTVAAFAVVLFSLVVQGLTIRPLVQFLKLIPQPEQRQNYETTRARLVSARAAERRLGHLYNEGAITENTYHTLTGTIQSQKDLYSQELDLLYGAEPELQAGELRIAQIESFRAQRSELFDLNRRGIISDDTYRALTAEVDAQLNILTRTPAERRAIARGPGDDHSPQEPL
jgi:CPA1 family monovalent cation:H+ antiporter